MEAELLVALEQLEAVEAALLTHPADADLLRAKAELTELLTLSSLLHAPTTNLVDARGAEDGGDGDKGAVADMFGGNDDEWERTHKREFALHTERQKQAFSTSTSSTPAVTSSSSSSSSSSSTKCSGQGDDVEDEQAGWLACRVVVTESLGGGGFGGPRPRRVWREGLLHSRAPDEAGRYRVTLLHSRLVHEVRAEDVLLQGATLKHLNHDHDHHQAKAGDDGGRKRKRRRVGGGESEDDEESSDSDDGFAGFSLMRATGGHDYVVGAWESHTSGIGSRLLARMGYTPGKGLGRGGEGIVKPLGIGLKAPSRKKELLGLGHDERTSKRGNDGSGDGDGADDDGEDRRSQAFDEAGNPIPRKRRRGGKKSRNKKAAAARDDEGERKASDVFGFLNEIGQVGGTAKTGGGRGGGEERQKREKEQEKREDGYKKMSAKELQDSLKRKIIEKDDVSAKIKQLEDSVHRNKDRDPAMAAQSKQRMREARTRLHSLHAEIKELATRVKIKEGTKKTIVF